MKSGTACDVFLSGVLLLPDPPPESVDLGAQLLRVRVEVAEKLGLELDDLVAVLKEGRKELDFKKISSSNNNSRNNGSRCSNQ